MPSSRIDDPDKRWKFDPADFEYQRAYKGAIDAMDTDDEIVQGLELRFPELGRKPLKLKIE